ncbi:MAG: pilus assembly protein PilM [Myxococcota bacterium]|nr:pilus assembly protein PilM [Myxococcota bacterium]
MARVLGIDVGEARLRAALVRTTLRRAELLACLEVPIAPASGSLNAATSAGVAQPSDSPRPSAPSGGDDSLREAVRALAPLARPAPQAVVVHLPGVDVSLRAVELPAAATRRVAEVLPHELEGVLPFDPEQAVLAFQPVQITGKTVRLLAAAALRERVAARIARLKAGGLEPREMAAGAAALDGLVALVPELASGGPWLLLDVEPDHTDVCVLQGGRTAFARTLSAGMVHARDGSLEVALRQTLAAWLAAGGDPPARALLCGDAADDPHAPGWLAARLGCDVEPLALPPVAGTDGAPARFARAVALAARVARAGPRIDLLQGEFAPRVARSLVREHGRRIAIGATVVMACFGLSVWARHAVVSAEHETLRARLGEVTERVFGERVTDPARARELLRRGPRQTDPLPRFDAFDALAAISEVFPADVGHDVRRLTIELEDEGPGGRVDLHGTLASVAERDRVAEALEGHPCFERVEKGPTRPGPGGQGLNYELQAIIACPGETRAPATKTGSRVRRGG